MKVAVIPARGGSKRIPRKNIRDFLGKPMVAHSIERAAASGLFDRVLVSTDDEEIAEVARRFGADAPFRRPAELASDHAGTMEVIAHAIRFLRGRGDAPSSVCCIYPAAPLTAADSLVRALSILEQGDVDFVFPAVRMDAPIHRAFRRREGGGIEMLFPEHFGSRSQDLPVAWRDAGQFYWGSADAWCAARPIFGERSRFIEVPRWEAQDIDDEEDWHMVQLLAAGMSALAKERPGV